MPGVKRTIATPKVITPTLNAIRHVAGQNPDAFIQQELRVRDKVAGVVPFSYRHAQTEIAAAIAETISIGDPVRLFVLKSRQVGSSTLILYRFFALTWAINNLEGVVVAHLEKRAEELLQRIKFCYADMKAQLRIALAQDSKHGIMYADTMGQLVIVSAKNLDAARGGTKQLVQLSEFAYYRHPMSVLNEFQQIVAYKPGTEILIETTGKGYGSDAHLFWQDCEKGRTPFKALFCKWQDDPECDYQFSSDKDRDLKVGMALEYEPRLEERMKYHRLSPGNVYYSYLVLKNQCNGDWDYYLQEYPCDSDEAWRLRGSSFFGTENINRIKAHVRQFKPNYKIFGCRANAGEEFHDLNQLDGVEHVDENGDLPYFAIWREPHRNGWYVVSGDSAEGLEDGNYSSTYVVDINTLEMMAEFHGKVRPDEHAKIMASLATIYNFAIAAPEINSPGNVTLNELTKIYTNIYRWRIFDDYKLMPSRKLGWQTNTQSRPLMLAYAKRLVEELARGNVLNLGLIKSAGLLGEMATFQVDEMTGKPEAIPGAQDDRVLAWSICLIVAAQETHGTGNDVMERFKTQPNEIIATPRSPDDWQHDPEDIVRKLKDANAFNQPWGSKDNWDEWRKLNGWQ